ncbi:MAG: hypothetical protein CVV47_01310 [Spirochaetae bacterium HGW-Spirochaetae-3]|jgi:formylglycine-generating enzyme required for sulfatase activity|nr:MAG: hypothetical protein CVV47_01310 [Spirochaetae bacterium HGW-Spirochaetae-3]
MDSYNPAMKDDKTLTQQDIDDATVRLKPILGVPPRKYLAAVYGAAVLVAAFLLLLYPGIRRPGVVYSITADPPGSAIYVDGVYRGFAPCDVFVAAGDRAVRVNRPGFDAYEGAIRSKARLFGTLFVKPRADLAVTLSRSPGYSLLGDGMRSYASWALSGTPSESYQIPMVLSDAARAASILPSSIDADGLAGVAASYANHAQSLRDAARAVSIAYGRSAAVTPVSLGRLVSALATELRDDPAMLTALAAYSTGATRERLESSGLYRSLLERTVAAASVAASTVGPTSILAGAEFVAMGPGRTVVTAGAALSAVSFVPRFGIASAETTVGEFRRFVAARPEWGYGAAADLTSKGLAEADYLKGFTEADQGDVLRYVSRPAAIAYCDWLTETAAPVGMRFALPTEAQWSYAAAASSAAGLSAPGDAVLAGSGSTGPVPPGSLRYDAAGLKGMLGNVWEWCGDSYAAHPAAGMANRDRYPSSEALVRGGSWANLPDLVSLASRGPMRETECSPYLGFRVALAPDSER